jgi:hypothetical protein
MCCLSFDLRIFITPLVSSNYSYFITLSNLLTISAPDGMLYQKRVVYTKLDTYIISTYYVMFFKILSRN